MPRSMFYDLNRASNSKSSNLLSGDVNEFVPYNATITVYGCTSALGMRMSFLADSDVVIDDKEIPYISTSLDVSAHFIDSFDVAGGTRLAVFLRDVSGVATTDTYVAVDIQPA